MQTLVAGQYNALDMEARNPCARVYVQKNYDSIPFAGKSLQSTLTNEKYPFVIEHSTGRVIIVYSKYSLYNTHYQLYFKSSDINQEIWSDGVLLAAQADSDYLNPTSIQINSSNNIGIIVSKSGVLHTMVVTTDGTITTAISSLAITGNTPCLTKVGTTYWLAYEASGICYYRTSADFITWSSATSLNTKTGLSNSHYNPYLYYDSSNKLWFCFERVTDASTSPIVINVYYMISTNQGSTWESPVAQTSFVAGEGSSYRPSVVDNGSYRYYSYSFQRQVQNLPPTNAVHNNGIILDDTNNRMIYIDGGSYNNQQLRIYNRTTGLTASYLLSDHGLSSGAVNCIDYDEVNQIVVIGTSTQGLIIYSISTTTWSQYKTTTTPAILANNISALRIKNRKIYYYGFQLPAGYLIGLFDLSSLVATTIQSPISPYPLYFSKAQVFISNTYAIFITHSISNYGGLYSAYPNIHVIRLSDNTVLYNTNIGYGSAYSLMNGVYNVNRYIAYDEVNDYLYSNAKLGSDVAITENNGFIKYQVGASAISLIKYYNNSIDNIYGILPNPDWSTNNISAITNLVYSDNKLYIQCCTLYDSGTKQEYCYQVFDTSTELIESYYAPTDANDYNITFPAIDSLFNKILLSQSYIPSSTYNIFTANEFGEIVFYSSNTLNYFTILQTSSESNRVYYMKTEDDIVWDTPTYLTKYSSDDNLKLTLLDDKLSAFWTRFSSGVYSIYFDTNLGEEIDITDKVVSFTITKNEENKSNKANIIIEDKNRIYHPLNYNSLKYNYLSENNIIRIEKGNNGYYSPAFYGYIGGGISEDIRGSDVVYSLDVFDRSKNFYRKKITTPFFDGQTVEYIADYIAANYLNLSIDEYNTLPSLTNIIHQVQFIDEYPMDILQKIYQPFNYFAFFDEEGNLKAKKYNYEASVDYTYYQDGTDTIAHNKAPAMNIVSFGFSWSDDELVNQVKVTGETEELYETVFDEEFMGTIQGTVGWFSKSNSKDFYFSDDKTLECVSPRLSVTDSCGNKFFGGGESLTFIPGTGEQGENNYCTITQNVSNLINALYILVAAILICSVLYGFGIGGGWGAVYVHVITWNPMAAVLAMVVTILGQIGSYSYDIYAKPVGEPLPETIYAVANDTTLQTDYGSIITKEIENPFLTTYEDCYALAENELEKALWFRYISTIKILSNPGLQIGDVLSVYNPNTDLSYIVYITEIEVRYSRGTEDIDTIKGGLIR